MTTRLPPTDDAAVPADRRALMQGIRSKDTQPELVVRRVLHRLGFRYRLHRRGLPGTPDIVFANKQKAIFVHGCFWHRHPDCRSASTPKTRASFWVEKFAKNVERDIRKGAELEAIGWSVLIVWSCEIKDTIMLERRLVEFLADDAVME
jgi:DNA mismatch endonuclease, patch repair protein